MRPVIAVSVRPGRSVRLLALLAVVVCGCAKSENSPDSAAITPAYDTATGKLKELAYDSNHNGVVDTWTDMDGPRPVRTRIDSNEDGKVDRWEYYDAHANLTKIGVSRGDDGKANAWVFAGPDGAIDRIEISAAADEKKIDRWEHYRTGAITSAEEDTNHDGTRDKWETYESGVVRTVSFDENADGQADRRLTYAGGTLVSIESEPDTRGTFTKRLEVGPAPPPSSDSRPRH
jgi:hypothetical protein